MSLPHIEDALNYSLAGEPLINISNIIIGTTFHNR